MTTPVSKHNRPPQDYVRIFDTTLRDGEQCPGATLTSEEKLEVARALSRLGVDVIEAGFPSASPDDFQAVHDIAESIGVEPISGRPSSEPPIICGLARATEKDIQTAFDAIKVAKFPRIHIFLATSPLHREHKLRMTREQVVARAREMVSFAKTLCDDIEFSPEDAGRTEPEFLHEVLTAVIECGATTLNIPDTVGYTVPAEFGAIIDGIMKNVKGIENVIVSVHCHDDLGLATANALAGIHAGARQAEVTINGIGERAGNTSLEEVVMALQTRQPMYGLKTGIDATQLVRTSRLVSVRTGMVVPPNKAIVGANAFAHESGIHQDGMLKHAGTYEIMRPETVGASKTLLVMGKHSGRHAFSVRLKELGHALDGEALEAAFQRFKVLADKKKRITDADLEALAASEVGRGVEYYALDAVQVVCGSSGMPTATVRLRCPDGELRTQAAVGTGPVHAVFTAIDEIVKAPSELVEYTINAVTEGIDALGHASVRVRAVGSSDNRLNAQHGSGGAAILHGQAADSDVLVASTKAYLGALNRLLVTLGTYDKQADKSQVTEKSPIREQTTGAAE
ncbi:MAG TPA: 2-isopropylmalate synthase [Polyangiaceae bacterium]|jgi:2-isopropylmalate synthase|nr:2-isopropylmalate synthase [Polyangiaceae bacterium]